MLARSRRYKRRESHGAQDCGCDLTLVRDAHSTDTLALDGGPAKAATLDFTLD